MKMRFFDFEVTPNWWLCVFGDLPEDCKNENGTFIITEEVKNNFVSVNSDMIDARGKLMNLMREPGYVLVGYNIKGYDLIIANAIYQGFTPQQVKIVNDIIINPGCAWSTKEHCRMAPFAKKKLSGIVYQDLLDDNDGSLKEKEAVLGLNIQESSVPFDTECLTKSDKDDLEYYCKHDVYACMYYATMYGPEYNYIQTKLLIGSRFNIPEDVCYACTNPKLIGKVLGCTRISFDDKDRIDIELPARIKEYVYENVSHTTINQLLTSTNQYNTKEYNNDVQFGNGGLHSVYRNDLYVESDDEWMLLNADGASFYPAMLINFDCLSRTVASKQAFVDIFNERLQLKKKPNKTKEDKDTILADKLVLNSTYGASGCKWLDLYDPYQTTKTCRIGQLFLTALACKLYKTVNGLQVIQANTDGLLLYFRRSHLHLVKKCFDEWTKVGGIVIEEDEVAKIWQRDVNNYLLVKTNGEVKCKGGWLSTNWWTGVPKLSPRTGFVSAKAVIKYLVHGEDIVKNIVANTNIEDFIINCKKGPSYSKVIQRMENGEEIELFKCNRIIACKDKTLGKLYKVKTYKGKLSYTQMPNSPDHCLLMNEDLSTYAFDDYKNSIDYTYYLGRCADMLDIEWYQLKHNNLIINDNFNYFR